MVTMEQYRKFMKATGKAHLIDWQKENPDKKPFIHYSYDKIKTFARDFEKSHECTTLYYMTIGERSNGKTYAALADALFRYFRTGEQFAYLRRWDEDIKSYRAQKLFAGHVNNNLVTFLSEGKWTGIYYQSGAWYLSREEEDDKGRIITERDRQPIGFSFALNTSAHDKSISYPKVTTIIFDEFIEPSYGHGYLFNEFEAFTNFVSTIVRLDVKVTIYMLANSVNRIGCVYFKEMGLKNLKHQKPGEIVGYIYHDEDTGVKMSLVLEYVEPQAKSKPSNIYFAFNNPRLKMITHGGWEIPSVPHIPIRIRPEMIKYRAFLRFDGETICMQVIQGNYTTIDDDDKEETHYADFLAVVPWGEKIKDEDTKLVYSPVPDPRPNHRINIRKPYYPVEKRLTEYIRADRVFFADNDTGNTFKSYLQACKNMTV